MGEWGGAAEQAHPYSPLTLGSCLVLAQWLTMAGQDRGTAQLAISKRDGVALLVNDPPRAKFTAL